MFLPQAVPCPGTGQICRCPVQKVTAGLSAGGFPPESHRKNPEKGRSLFKVKSDVFTSHVPGSTHLEADLEILRLLCRKRLK